MTDPPSSSTNLVIFTLPAGYRPSGRELFIMASGASAQCRVDVLANGEVICVENSNNSWLSLSAITFYAGL